MLLQGQGRGHGTKPPMRAPMVITTADVLFYSRNKVESKKGHNDRKCPIFHAISLGYKVHVSVSAHGRHEMITRTVVCPPLS